MDLSVHRKKIDRLKAPALAEGVHIKQTLHFRLYRLEAHMKVSSTTLLPTIIYFPGTAFVARETKYTDAICSLIVSECFYQIIAIFPELMPETSLVSSVEKVYKLIDTLLFLDTNNQLNIDKNKIVIAGYSSGGTFATLTAIYLKKHGLSIQRQFLISPVTDLSRTLTSYQNLQNRDPVIPEWFVRWFLNIAVPKHMAKDPKISPYWGTNIRVPPTTILYGENDRFLADSKEYVNKLSQQNNQVNSYSFPEAHHGFLWTDVAVSSLIASMIRDVFCNRSVPRNLFKKDHDQVQTRIETKFKI